MIYDLIIIGGGPAGYHAAERAGHNGLKTALFEKKNIGGVCLNEGCIPSKTLLYSAKLFDNAKTGEKYGLSVENARLDHKKVIERKNRVVRTLVTGIRSALKKNNVEIFQTEASVKGFSDGVFEIAGGEDLFYAKKILLATGSSPVIPPIKGIDEGIKNRKVLTSADIFSLETIPEKMVIIGAGIIGLEMASYFNSLGSKVTVMEMTGSVAGNLDKDLASVLIGNYKKKGVDFKFDAKVTEIGSDHVDFSSGDADNEIEADLVLVCTGRTPNTNGLGLENIGLKTEKGFIKTDEFCMTGIPGVYAAGDVNGNSMLAHTAYREAEVCINNIQGIDDRMDYRYIPSVIYTNPEIAVVGESEDSCEQKGIEYDVVKVPLRFSGRYLAENEMGDGICKMLVDKQKRIAGFHMIGNYSSEMIYGLSMMMQNEMKTADILKTVFPHPTVSEIIKEGIFHLG